MTMSDRAFFWRSNPEWWRPNPETGDYEMTEKAPPEAVKSFVEWLKGWSFPIPENLKGRY